jgi:hypothetical protein
MSPEALLSPAVLQPLAHLLLPVPKDGCRNPARSGIFQVGLVGMDPLEPSPDTGKQRHHNERERTVPKKLNTGNTVK